MTKTVLSLVIAAIVLSIILPTLFSAASAAEEIGQNRQNQMEEVEALFAQ